MPEERPTFSRAAQEAIGQFRGIPFAEPAKMRRRPTKDIGSVLEDLRIKYQIGRASPEQAIRERWSELVGPANATYSHPARIDLGRKLVVHVSHSVVRNEIFLNREAIVGRIQKLPGCGKVTSLHLLPG